MNFVRKFFKAVCVLTLITFLIKTLISFCETRKFWCTNYLFKKDWKFLEEKARENGKNIQKIT